MKICLDVQRRENDKIGIFAYVGGGVENKPNKHHNLPCFWKRIKFKYLQVPRNHNLSG